MTSTRFDYHFDAVSKTITCLVHVSIIHVGLTSPITSFSESSEIVGMLVDLSPNNVPDVIVHGV